MAVPAARAARRTAAPSGGGLRWDRITRWVLLGLIGVLLLLYVAPVRSYLQTRDRAAQQASGLKELRTQNATLRARRAALRRPGSIELEARRNGMVKPGERAFVVTGLTAGR